MATKKTAALKTTKTKASVADFLAGVADEDVRRDCKKLVAMMKRVTGAPAAMWGASLVGFGQYHYVYPSGREGDWPLVSFSPRKKNLSIYIMPGLQRYAQQLAKLGPHETGKSCLLLDGLADIDLAVLEEIVRDSVARMKAQR